MCGIVGYIGDKNASEILMTGLTKLEYRGYDSAGVAILNEGQLNVTKCEGRLLNLKAKLEAEPLEGTLGIGHTRWATHGVPNDVNSHPHISSSGRFAIVHNGIIENYVKLKEMLIRDGAVFHSDTDSEVIANLIEKNYHGDLVHAVRAALEMLDGTYALGVICRDCPDRFVAARNESPLIIGLGKNENYIASDIPAILKHTREVMMLEDDEIALITRNSVVITDRMGNEVNREIMQVKYDVKATSRGGYEHYMMKEMFEEPSAVRKTIEPHLTGGVLSEGTSSVENLVDEKKCLANVSVVMPELDSILASTENLRKIYIIACGTAYHAGVVAKYLIEKLARIEVEVDVASEFRYRDSLINENCLAIIISQSGETLDSFVALKECKRKGAKTLAIVNVEGSSIAREADEVIYTQAGPEIAVASTKAYNTQLAVLYLIALRLAEYRDILNEVEKVELLAELKKIPEYLEAVLAQEDVAARLASLHYNAKSIFFIGRGLDYALSMEGSLKLKEISYVHSEAYAGGELKHGPIALIEEGSLVICLATQDDLVEKMVGNMEEVKARGADVVAVTQEKNRALMEKGANDVITIPNITSCLSPIVGVTPLQLFAYYMAVQKGCDVDKPRNLAKSVTVE